jgi:hypothetical protein
MKYYLMLESGNQLREAWEEGACIFADNTEKQKTPKTRATIQIKKTIGDYGASVNNLTQTYIKFS